MDELYVSRDEFNGLGQRLTQLDREEVSCQARTGQQIANINLRLDSQNADIQRLYAGVASVTAAMNKGIGIMIAVNVFFAGLIVLADRFLK
jgi:hypothetical protein